MKKLVVSFTQWKRFNECPQKDHLYRTGKKPKTSDNRNFIKGSVLHELFEKWMTSQHPPEWILTQVDVEWDNYLAEKTVIWKHDNDKAENLAKAKLWAQSLVDIIHELKVDRNRCFIEKKIGADIEVDGVTVRLFGIVDFLLYTRSGDWVVLDWKFSENKQTMNPWQLVFYSLLLQMTDPAQIPNHGVFILPALKKVKMFPHELNQEQRDWLLGDIQRMVREIFAGEQTPDPENANCFWCDVQNFCPAYGAPANIGRGRTTLFGG